MMKPTIETRKTIKEIKKKFLKIKKTIKENQDHQENHDEKPNLRRSQRTKKPKCQCCKVKIDFQHLPKDPLTVEKALNCPDIDKWEAAMLQEMERLESMDTWKIVPRPTEHKLIDCKWVFRRKYSELCEVMIHKERLMARGFCLTPGVDDLET